MDNDTVIGSKEASEILGYTQEGVTKLLRRGKIKGKRIGRTWAISRASVEEYKAGREQRVKRSDTQGPQNQT